jgi:POT family proton-dependent oligopeptide transporter
MSDTRGIAGHPRGLTTLFFTELWERFSYYGMRAILILYMVAPMSEGGLGFAVSDAASLYGTYTMAVYLMALPGGFIADQWLGARRAVLIGGSIIACGHGAMASGALPLFYIGLALITIGTGLLKPSISALVGDLYEPHDARRDAGFAIFFMGINVGAALAPFVCGFLAQSATFRMVLQSLGIDPHSSWHWGFGAAGVGMVLGLAHFVLQRYDMDTVAQRHDASLTSVITTFRTLTREEWQRVGVICILFVFTVIFGVVSEQAGSSLNLFADRLTRTRLGMWDFPSSWFQSAVPLFVILLSPIVSWLWVRLGDRQPSSPAKFSLSLLFVGLAYLLMVPASLVAAEGKVSPFWLLGVFFLQEIGAVLLNPTGLSVVTKLAPVRLTGMMMGVWFLASAVASKIAGFLAGFFDERNTTFLAYYFGGLSSVMMLAALLLAVLTPFLRRLMGGVR